MSFATWRRETVRPNSHQWLLFLLLPVLMLTASSSVLLYGPSLVPPNHPLLYTQSSLLEQPLVFTPAQNTSAGDELFSARYAGGLLHFRPDTLTIRLPEVLGHPTARTVEMQFVGTSPSVSMHPTGRLAGLVNYLSGENPALWRTNVPTFASLYYSEIFDGIDLHFTNHNGQLKGTYFVAPGSDPTLITWRYSGPTRSRVHQWTGNLEIFETPSEHRRPALLLVKRQSVAWQIVGGEHVSVAVHYQVSAKGEIGFQVGRFNPRYPLVIDPSLEFARYLGDSERDEIHAIARDTTGNEIRIDGSRSRPIILISLQIKFDRSERALHTA